MSSGLLPALFGTILTVWGYYKCGRLATHQKVMDANDRGEEPPHKRLTPFPAMVAKGASHCGSGCAVGDICAEFLALFFPVVAVWLGWKSIFPDGHHGKIFAVWILDFVFAFLFGIAFHYFTIVPLLVLPMNLVYLYEGRFSPRIQAKEKI